MAIDALDLALEKLGPPIYVFHEIVHNQRIVADFRSRGVVFVDAVQEVPVGEVLMFSAHGVSPQVKRDANARSLLTIDATCPLVTKVHLEAISRHKSGHELILIGHQGHDEVVGTLGEAPDAFHLVETIEDVDRLEFDQTTPLAWLTQTTLSVSDTEKIVDRIKKRFPGIVGPRKDDICFATQNRQYAVKELCRDADAVVVVGSRNSSNSQRLRETASQSGAYAVLVDDASQLIVRDFASHQHVAVTAGASAPEEAVQEVVDWFVLHFNASVDSHTFMEEPQVFPLPKELASIRSSPANLAAAKNDP